MRSSPLITKAFQATALALLGVLFSSSLTAQEPVLSMPDSVRQGDTLRVKVLGVVGGDAKAKLEFGDQSIPLFPLSGDGERGDGQGGDGFIGLVPVPVLLAPGGYIVFLRDGEGKEIARRTVTVLDAGFPIQNIRTTGKMRTLQPLPGEMETIRGLQQTVSPMRFWREPFLRPAPRCMNSPFGVLRHHDGKPTGAFHRGIDQRAAAGARIRAIAAGMVRISKMYRLHGGTVGLDHGQGVASIYIHLSRLAVQEGAAVEAGDVVGYAGSTGFATGPHLHWGLYVNGHPVNPLQWIPSIAACP